jgi:uncharacterized protein (TIGR00369 family)
VATDATPSLELALHDLLGLVVSEVGPDRVVMAWTVDERHLQPFGLAHGGIHCLVNESAASIAAAVWLGADGKVVGVNNSTDFLRASRPGTAFAPLPRRSIAGARNSCGRSRPVTTGSGWWRGDRSGCRTRGRVDNGLVNIAVRYIAAHLWRGTLLT